VVGGPEFDEHDRCASRKLVVIRGFQRVVFNVAIFRSAYVV
jgi:hypothetical protein